MRPVRYHDYSVEKSTFVEIEPNHFILANSSEVKCYKKEMADFDRIASGEESEVEKLATKARKSKKPAETE